MGDDLEQPGVGVAGVSPGEQVLEVLLAQDKLHPLHVLRIVSPQRLYQVDFIIVQGPDSLQNFPDNDTQIVT